MPSCPKDITDKNLNSNVIVQEATSTVYSEADIPEQDIAPHVEKDEDPSEKGVKIDSSVTHETLGRRQDSAERERVSFVFISVFD